MKAHIASCLRNFGDGCDRAVTLCAIYNFLTANAPKALDCDDVLRSAVVLLVSSFDLFIHDLFRTEVVFRLENQQNVEFLKVPYNFLVADAQSRSRLLDRAIRADNSFKSFVAPEKVSECLRPFVKDLWERVASVTGQSASACKLGLRSIVDLRNRIAHEADVNPDYGGVELWPIYRDDVESSIEFLRHLGHAIALVASGR